MENAKKSSRVELHIGKLPLPQPPKPEAYRRYFQDLTIPRPDLERRSEKKDQVLEELTEQMKQPQKRIEQLEQRHRETPRRLLDPNQQDSEDNDDAATGRKVPVVSESEPAV